MTANQMPSPPNIAVGFLCQRSVFGFATNPRLLASRRTSGVSASASANDTRGGTKPETFSGNIKNGPSELVKSYSIAGPKASQKIFAGPRNEAAPKITAAKPILPLACAADPIAIAPGSDTVILSSDDGDHSWRDWMRVLGTQPAAQLCGE